VIAAVYPTKLGNQIDHTS